VTTTRWLDQAELASWVRLAAVLEILPGVLDSQLRRDAGLTHYEYYVLAMLSEAPKRTMRMTALAQLTTATLPRLSHVVKRLEDRGLIERHRDPDDKRRLLIALTPSGRAILDDRRPHVAAIEKRMTGALSTSDTALLRRFLAECRTSLES